MKNLVTRVLAIFGLLIVTLFLAGCEWGAKEKAVPVFQGLTYELEGSSQVVLREGNFYASRHAYVLIGVNFLNPDDQSILALKINNQEFLSFAFASGSTNQKVLILVDAGSALGQTQFVVSDITYLGKDESKAVVMTGSDTLSLEVIGNNIPSATLEVLDKSYTYATLSVDVRDLDLTIDVTSLHIELYKGSVLDQEIPLVRGTQSIELDTLLPNQDYTLKIIASYSLFDDLDQADMILVEKSFSTLSKSVVVSQITYHSAQFALVDGGELEINTIEVYQNNIKIQEITNHELRLISQLLSNTNYELRVTYSYLEEDVITLKVPFKTLTKATPAVLIKNIRPDDTSATFELSVTDRLITGNLQSIKVYRGSTLITTLPDLTRRIIESLDNNYEYRLEVIYSYDLGDGVGSRSLTEHAFFTTSTPTTIPTNPGTDLEQIVTGVVTMVEQTVIGVSNFGPILENSGVQTGLGSGVIYKRVANLIDPSLGEVPSNIIDYTYFVFTNKHVIETETSPDDINKIKVYIDSERLYIDAILMGKDAKVDIAVIKFNHSSYYPVAALGDSDQVVKGSFAIAIGNPSGYNYYGSVTFGVISHPKRFVPEDNDNDGVIDFNAQYVQHDVAINPGNSGGGLFNLKGELIGINTMKFVDAKIDNMGFAVPIDVIKLLAFSYLEEGIVPPRARLGITVISVLALTPELIVERNLQPVPSSVTYGVYIVEVSPDTTISNSVIAAHDILLKFDDIDIYATTELAELLSDVVKYGIGTNVELTYYSRADDMIKTTIVTLRP